MGMPIWMYNEYVFENKYLVLFQQNSHDFLAYRVRLVVNIINQFMAPLVIMLVLTNLIGNSINGMTKSQIVNYYLSTSILYLFLNSKIDSYIKEAIQQGEISTYLIRPINFWLVALVKDISARVIKLMLGLPILVLLILIFSMSFPTLSPDMLVSLLMIPIALLLAFSISFCVGALAFWFEEVWGFQNLKEVAILLLSGVVLPYTFFPKILQRILTFTPFPYLINWPLHKGFSGNIAFEFSMAILWLVLLLGISAFMWKAGTKRYCAAGG